MLCTWCTMVMMCFCQQVSNFEILGMMVILYKGVTDLTLTKKMWTIWRLCRWVKYPQSPKALSSTRLNTMRRTPCIAWLKTSIGAVLNPVDARASAQVDGEPFRFVMDPWNARTPNANTEKFTSLQTRLTLIAQTNVYTASTALRINCSARKYIENDRCHKKMMVI